MNLNNALERLDIQKENQELAEEIFVAARNRYSQGLGSNFEVVEADSGLKEAQSNYFFALYDALIARIDLKKALGVLY
jgi:outer membrane protein